MRRWSDNDLKKSPFDSWDWDKGVSEEQPPLHNSPADLERGSVWKAPTDWQVNVAKINRDRAGETPARPPLKPGVIVSHENAVPVVPSNYIRGKRTVWRKPFFSGMTFCLQGVTRGLKMMTSAGTVRFQHTTRQLSNQRSRRWHS